MLQCIAKTATQNNFGADDRQKQDILPTPENKFASVRVFLDSVRHLSLQEATISSKHIRWQ